MPEQDETPRTFTLHLFPAGYTGAVYVKVAAPAETGHDVEVNLLWGPWRKLTVLPEVDAEGWALVCTKTNADSVPLRVRTTQPLLINFGQGLPDMPGERVLDCNEGWVLQ